jgi:hypothetical protein
MHVVVLCYRRQKLLRDLIKLVLNSNVVSSVDFIVDACKSPEHQIQVKETIATIEELAPTLGRELIRIKIFEKPVNFMEHVLRTHQWVMKTHKKYIVLEEDTLISHEGLNFISNNFGEPAYSKILCSYTSYQHSELEIVKSLSPHLWAAAFNEYAFIDFERVSQDKEIDFSIISNTIREILPNKSLIQKEFNFRAIRYWNWYFNKALESGSHPDVIQYYAQWRSGNYVDVATQSFAEDISYLSDFAMNPRTKEIPSFHEIDKLTRQSFSFCGKCEIHRARVERSSDFIKRNVLYLDKKPK